MIYVVSRVKIFLSVVPSKVWLVYLSNSHPLTLLLLRHALWTKWSSAKESRRMTRSQRTLLWKACMSSWKKFLLMSWSSWRPSHGPPNPSAVFRFVSLSYVGCANIGISMRFCVNVWGARWYHLAWGCTCATVYIDCRLRATTQKPAAFLACLSFQSILQEFNFWDIKAGCSFQQISAILPKWF